MNNAIFPGLEEKLRHFLHEAIIDLAGGELDEVELKGKKRIFNELELSGYIAYLREHSSSPIDGVQFLFDKYRVPQSLGTDIVFVGNLRHKYFHGRGCVAYGSDDQLADLIIIRRVVRTLNAYTPASERGTSLTGALDKAIFDLTTQMAEATDPERFDRQGEERVLSSDDREFIESAVRGAVLEAIPSKILDDSNESGTVSASDLEVSLLRKEVSSIKRSLSPMRAMQKTVNGIEKMLVEGIPSVEEKWDEIRAFYEERESGDETDYEFDSYIDEEVDEDVDVEGEDYRYLALQVEQGVQELRDGIAVLHRTINPLTSWEARDQLIGLRRRIWKATGEGPSADGLLRKSMIDEFLSVCPSTTSDAHQRMSSALVTVTETQLPYLDEVCAITRRVSSED